MTALAAAFAALKVGTGDLVTRYTKASTAVYQGGFVQKDANGDIAPLDTTTTSSFDGVATQSATSTQTTREIQVTKRGRVLCAITGVTRADIGKPVYCSTDNPNDATLAYSASAKQVGWVSNLEYSPVTGAFVANKCWVYFDADLIAGQAQVFIVGHNMRTLVGTVEECNYRVPVGRKATLISFDFEYDAKPNYATSSVLKMTKVTGTTRTTMLNAASININNQANPAIDTVQNNALSGTPADLSLAANDRIMASVTQVGAETTPGNVKAYALVAEMAA
jgi:hypothetical protein